VADELPGPDEMTGDDIGHVLGTLITAHPGFRIRYDRIGWLGDRWIAERIKGLDPGVHTMITADARELHDILTHDRRSHAG
jgi:hypothetical protein